MIERRRAIRILGGGLVGAALLGGRAFSANAKDNKSFSAGSLARDIVAIESANGGRLGVAVLDTASGARFAHRGDEPFPMCSTFKFLLAGAILHRCDAHQERLDRRIAYTAADLVAHSPVTSDHVAHGMTVSALCEATMTTSDNTAANLLLTALGGIAAFNAFVRVLGDVHSRIDRFEPTLNTATPGDVRDTTTPTAMLANLDRLLLGNTLSPASRALLTGWLVANRTGDARLRAGLPRGWRVGDKTGSGDHGTVNDIAIVWPEGRSPLLIACYLTASQRPIGINHAVHADVARAIVRAIA